MQEYSSIFFIKLNKFDNIYFPSLF